MSTSRIPAPESSEPRQADGPLESLRRKLHARRGERAGTAPASAGPAEPGPDGASRAKGAGIIYARDVPRTQVRPSSYAPPTGRFLPLTEAVKGRESPAPVGPPYHRVEEPLETVHPQLAAYCRDTLLSRPRLDLSARVHLQPLQPSPAPGTGKAPSLPSTSDSPVGGSVSPRDLVFLDLETTGLSSSPLFLIGTLVVEAGGFVIRQFLARTYAEERSIISAFAEELAGRPGGSLVSFNGRCFDVPYLRARAAATGVPFTEPPTHLDLLPAARRAYGSRLPDCRLKTLERSICSRHRAEDIPGEQIPDAYHYFVRTGNAVELADILRHNVWDLVTLLELMVRMTAGGGKGKQVGTNSGLAATRPRRSAEEHREG